MYADDQGLGGVQGWQQLRCGSRGLHRSVDSPEPVDQKFIQHCHRYLGTGGGTVINPPAPLENLSLRDIQAFPGFPGLFPLYRTYTCREDDCT